MAFQLGGEVRPAERREYGRAELTILSPDTAVCGVGNAGDTRSAG